MSLIPTNAQKIEVTGATVDFYELLDDGVTTYYFDTSKYEPPTPMVNAMSGLQLIKGTNNKLVMINHKAPGGLFAKLGDDVFHEIEVLDNGLFKVTFSYNSASANDTDLSQTSCD